MRTRLNDRPLRRLGRLWLLFQIPTGLLVLFASWVSPAGGLWWPLGVGAPACAILTVCALVAWWVELRSAASPGRASRPERRGSLWPWLWLPLVLAHGVLVPLAYFSAEFTLGGPRGGLAGGLTGYTIGLGVYFVCVGLPLGLIGRTRAKAQGRGE